MTTASSNRIAAGLGVTAAKAATKAVSKDIEARIGYSFIDPALLASGLSQLDRYLSRTWSRAGVPQQSHDDCTQAVYTSLLQNWGRAPFDELLAEVGLDDLGAHPAVPVIVGGMSGLGQQRDRLACATRPEPSD